MNKNCAFTIVAKNYIGLATILEKSIKQYFNDLDFLIIVADELSSETINYPENTKEAKQILEIDSILWDDMSFKYDLTEFCTSIKPFAINYCFEQGYEKVIYLDPDIFFFSSIQPIYDRLNDYDLILTPHILFPPSLNSSDSPERTWHLSGMYNLGFIALKNSELSKKITNWWSERLKSHCFIKTYRGEFTDQKWIDFVPCFVPNDKLLISRNLGWNMAPWNYFERKIQTDSGENLLVCPRNDINGTSSEQLVFVHFSGYNYKSLLSGKVIQNNIRNIREYPDLTILLNTYSKYLKENEYLFKLHIDEKYSYNYFSNGEQICIYHRRLYSGLKIKGERVDTPFSATGNLYRLFNKKGLISLTDGDTVKKTSIHNVSNLSKKIKIINTISRIGYRLLGPEKYFLLLKSLLFYTDFSNHIHLLDKKFDKNNISE